MLLLLVYLLSLKTKANCLCVCACMILCCHDFFVLVHAVVVVCLSFFHGSLSLCCHDHHSCFVCLSMLLSSSLSFCRCSLCVGQRRPSHGVRCGGHHGLVWQSDPEQRLRKRPSTSHFEHRRRGKARNLFLLYIYIYIIVLQQTQTQQSSKRPHCWYMI